MKTNIDNENFHAAVLKRSSDTSWTPFRMTLTRTVKRTDNTHVERMERGPRVTCTLLEDAEVARARAELGRRLSLKSLCSFWCTKSDGSPVFVTQ